MNTEDKTAAGHPGTGDRYSRAILDASNDAIFIHDLQAGVLVDVNRRAEEMYGHARAAMIGRSIGMISSGVHPYTEREALRWVLKVRAGLPQILEWQAKHADGTLFPVEVSVRSEVIDGRMLVIAAVRDITERKRAETQLHESEERLRLALTATNLGLYDLNVQTGECIVSPEYALMLGFDPDTFIETNAAWSERMHPDDREKVYGAYEGYITEKTDVYKVEFRMRTKAGTWLWVLSMGKLVEWDANGKPLRMLGTHTDISDRKAVEEKLREGEERYKALYEYAPLAYQSLDDEGCFKDINPAWLDILGYERDEVLGSWFGDYLHPDFKPSFKKNFANFKACGSVKDVQFLIRHKQGHYLRIEFEGAAGYHPDGSVKQTYCVFQDITVQYEAQEALLKSERALKESEDQYASLFSNLPGMVYRCRNDADWTMEFLSEGCVELTGLQPDELLHNSKISYNDLIHPDDRESVQTAVQEKLAIHESFEIEYRIYTALATAKWVWERGCGQYDDQGKLLYIEGFAADISERKAAEKAISESEIRFRVMLEQLPYLAVMGFGLDGRVRFWNEGSAHLYGYTKEDALGAKLTDLIIPDDMRAFTDRAIAETEKTGILPPAAEYVLRHKDGRLIPVLTCHASNHKKGADFEMFCLDVDISEQKETEEQLLQVNDIQSLILNNSTLGIALVRNRTFEWVNPRLSEIFMIPAEQMQGVSTRIIYSSDEAYKKTGDQMYQDIVGNLRADRVRQFQRKDGVLFWCRLVGKALDPEHPEAGSLWMFEDVSERKEAEDKLKESEKKRNDWLEHSPVCTQILDMDFNLQYMSAAGVNALKVEDVTLLYGKPYPFSFFPESFCEPMRKDLQKAKRTGEAISQEGYVFDDENNELWFQSSIIPVKSDQNQIEYMMVISRDITLYKQAEAKSRRLSTAIEQSPETVVITDLCGNIQYANPTFERISGYTQEEVIGQNPRILKSEEHDDAFYTHLWETIKSGHIWEGRLVNKHKDGTQYTEEVSISPVKDDAGITTNYVAVKRDITEELIRGEELRQSQKMDAVGRLAGGIAHDFNNILQGILGFSEILKLDMEEGRQEYDHICEIHKSAMRAAKLTRQLLTFSRKQPTQFTQLNMNAVIQDSEALLNVLLGENIELIFTLQEELPSINADSGQLSQIIMNLAVNARDAMPGGGRLTVTSELEFFSEQDAACYSDAQSGPYVCLSVTDTGTGMTEEIKERLFEPFFTTKDVGSGTGLGLAVVYGIVKESKGWINVYSEVGKGSCIRIYIPADSDPENSGGAGICDADGNARILLVEDDPDVCRMVKEILTESGYRTLATSSAEDGLRLFKDNNGCFDLLMSDMVLPGIRGDELADQIREIAPDMPVVLYSGYRDQKARWENLKTKDYIFINKPFIIKDLLLSINSVLKINTGSQ